GPGPFWTRWGPSDGDPYGRFRLPVPLLFRALRGASKMSKGDSVVASLVSWKVGGEQGQGIDSTGEILARTVNRLGYYVYGYKLFSSRIKGGHTNYKLRIGTQPVSSTSSDLQI